MKSFLKKILGGEEARAHKARSARVKIPLMDGAAFVDEAGQSFPLRNLSETGLALACPSGQFPEAAKGELRVAGQSVPVSAKAVRRSGDEVGLHFTSDTTALRALLRRVFGDEIHAQEMTEVGSELQKEAAVGQPRWFYAPGNYELFYVEHEGKVIRFELEWGGTLLVSAEGTLRVGQIDRSGEDREKRSHARSSLVKWADKVRPEDKAKAIRLLENIRGLDASLRKQMQEALA